MEITEYNNIKLEDMPIAIYKANCSFTSSNSYYKETYNVKGYFERIIIDGFRNNKSVGISFTIKDSSNNIFIYHGDNPNKLFTTRKEAKEWSEKDLGYIN